MLDRVSIRWRLAGTSAALTFVILLVFALAIGALTENRIRSDFDKDVALSATRVRDALHFGYDPPYNSLHVSAPQDLNQYSQSVGGEIRVLLPGLPRALDVTGGWPLNVPFDISDSTFTSHGYLIANRPKTVDGLGFPAVIQYARKESDLNATLTRVRLFLLFGVLGGSGLALIAGLLLARRAMQPVSALTEIARRIAQTRDPDQRVPVSPAGDEVAVLGRTLDEMLVSLAESRAATEAMLKRQRRFVADASHELRTPLTAVLANLELLTDVLEGPQGEAAHAALRSSQRMKRLVADLLLLARADGNRRVAREPLDLGQIAIEAASELQVQAGDHVLSLEVEPVVVDGVRDDLHRMVGNLAENALRHTPPGSHVTVRVQRTGERAVLTVADDGPGVDPELRDRVFDRFMRGAGDRGGSFGLGLSIVRVVAEQHGGTATLAPSAPGEGATFVVALPVHHDAPGAAVPVPEDTPATAPA